MTRPASSPVSRAGEPRSPARVAYRRERVAQLVGEYREELVLLAVGAFECALYVLQRRHVDVRGDRAAHASALVEQGCGTDEQRQPTTVVEQDVDLLVAHVDAVQAGALHRQFFARQVDAGTLVPVPVPALHRPGERGVLRRIVNTQQSRQ